MTLADLKGKPIVSMAGGAKIGEVGDLAIDVATWTIRDLLVSAKTGQGILPFSNVKSIGPDAVTVESEAATAWSAKTPAVAFDDFKKLHVVDGSGTVVGHAHDVTYDASGSVESFEVRQGGVLGIGAHVHHIGPAAVRGVGDKIITVELPVAQS